MNPIDERPTHRLFAAIVLMGTGLAVSCGGISESEGPPGSAGRTGAGDGDGTSTTTGSTDSVGPATSTGGSQNIGAAPHIDIGGQPSAPVPVVPGPFKCPPQQWNCASSRCADGGQGWVLPDDCECDPKRPLSVDDCQAGEVFVCQYATSTVDGHPFTIPVELSCSCQPKAMAPCTTECQIAFGGREMSCIGNGDQLSVSCGCAIIYLK